MLANIALWVNNERKSWWNSLDFSCQRRKKLKSAPCEDESIALSINKNCNGFSSFSSPLHQLTLLSASLNSTAKKEKKTHCSSESGSNNKHFPIHSFSALGRKFWAVFSIYTHSVLDPLCRMEKKQQQQSKGKSTSSWKKLAPKIFASLSLSLLLIVIALLCCCVVSTSNFIDIFPLSSFFIAIEYSLSCWLLSSVSLVFRILFEFEAWIFIDILGRWWCCDAVVT